VPPPKKHEPARERIEAGYTTLEKGPDGRDVYNNRPEPETMRLRMSRDEVTRVQPILVTHTGKLERTREYGFLDIERGVWVAYRMNRQGGVVRYDIADPKAVQVDTIGKEIKT
jgi:hypothetical protein